MGRRALTCSSGMDAGVRLPLVADHRRWSPSRAHGIRWWALLVMEGVPRLLPGRRGGVSSRRHG
jgi:hypothetical protein